MVAFATRRLAVLVAVFVAATLLVFLAVTALPGDPLNALSGQRRMTESTRAALTERYHLDDPAATRWIGWLGDVVRGDFGDSYTSRRPVSDVIVDSLPVSATLAVMTIAIEGVIGVSAGAVAAMRRKRFLDSLVLVSTTVAMAIPVFVLAALVRNVVGGDRGWLPTGSDQLGGFVLPALVLAAPALALVARLTRASLIDESNQAYVTTARAQGISDRRVLIRHTLRNSWAPIIAFLAVDFAALLAGAVVVESVFDLDGVGQALYLAIGSRDQPVIIGITVVLIGVFLVVNLGADIITAALDPRVRDA